MGGKGTKKALKGEGVFLERRKVSNYQINEGNAEMIYMKSIKNR